MKPTTFSDHDTPNYYELLVIMLVGGIHIVMEFLTSEPAAQTYNLIVSPLFLFYLLWRARRGKNVLRAWGMRTDNFWIALRAQLIFGAIGILSLIGFGLAAGTLALPVTFWVTFILYPIWGTAQQFALQNLIARNLKGLVSNPIALALVASILFAIAHIPQYEYVTLTLIAGIFFTWIYQRYPNLWAIGIVHGILGSMAVYIILQKDPGAWFWALLAGS